jgi:2-polyprenyl-3-methyl-5-hydroxy-6-metoxy-1,4-benzoquinol methylase
MSEVTTEIAEKIVASNIEVHRQEADIYDAMHTEIFGVHEQRRFNADLELIAQHLPVNSVIRVLDLGCGTGNLTLKYLARGYSVKAVDLSPEMVARLRAKVPASCRPRIDIQVCDACVAVSDPATRQTYDLVSFSSVLHHLPDYNLVVERALEQLKPGGLLWVCHEPLKISKCQGSASKRILGTLLQLVDSLYIYARKAMVYGLKTLRTRRLVHRIDYSWSDYHAIKGIDTNDLIRRIKDRGAEIISYSEHNSRYCSFLAFIDSKWQTAPPNEFGFIARSLHASSKS